MQLLTYIIIYPILWLISILPFRLLYGLSDIFYFFIFRIFKYRKKVVKANLRLVFPQKTSNEIEEICSKFYSHLCDLFLEMIKTLTISKSQLEKRFIIKNPENLKKLTSHNTSVVLMYGHYASYEWSTVIQSHIKIGGLGIYKKIKNPYFDRLAHRIRSKFNTELVNTKEALKRLQEISENNDPRMIAFLSDQSPKIRSKNHWLNFMDIKIPCFMGAELTAKSKNFPVGFAQIDKVKRGYYECEIKILSENPQSEEEYAITKKFNRLLEAQIKAKPEFYLWTHKRWKHRDKVPPEFQ